MTSPPVSSEFVFLIQIREGPGDRGQGNPPEGMFCIRRLCALFWGLGCDPDMEPGAGLSFDKYQFFVPPVSPLVLEGHTVGLHFCVL